MDVTVTEKDRIAFDKFKEEVGNMMQTYLEQTGKETIPAEDVRAAIHIAAVATPSEDIDRIAKLMPIQYKQALVEMRMYDMIMERK